jgi:hypothetical protein
MHEVILRAGYNFDMGAGLMFTNAYNVGKWDELKHSYNEIEGGIRSLSRPINSPSSPAG